ncbi:MAG: aminotransferase class I/II-fold pyridoxal phosphate-dependent enzyme [Brotaphodocola sp.]
MDKKELLLTKLMEYSKSDFYPMHMPGHKRNIKNSVLDDFPNPFSIDITEIEGFDNLHHPEKILKDSMEWAAGVYGADKSYYLVNGSSCGVLSAISAVTRNGGRILVSRNCHKSVYHGVILKQLKADYVYPQIMERLGIQGGILPEDVEKMLKIHPETEAVLIVSPTYDGVVSDIEKIADIVHRFEIPLIVDEAHGAHFSFGGPNFPVSALRCGADIVIQSLHKTLPSLTQTAILHVNKGIVNIEKLEYYLQMYQSSSPSYVFMAAMEKCVCVMEKHGYEYLMDLKINLNEFRQKMNKLRCLRILGCEKGKYGVFDLDPAKIIISCKGCQTADSQEKINGSILSDILRNRYHIEMEMSGADYVTAIASCFDTKEGLERLCKAILEIDQELLRIDEKNAQKMVCGWNKPEIRMNMSSAMESECEILSLQNCEGRTSAEFIYLYPPGIPIVAPGEAVTKDMIERVLEYKKMNLPVQGMADKSAEYLRVISEE